MIEEEACRFVVGSVNEKVDLPDEAGGIRLGEALTVGRNVAVGIGCAESLGSTVHLAPTDLVRGVERLTGEVAYRDTIVVAQREVPDPRSHKEGQES